LVSMSVSSSRWVDEGDPLGSRAPASDREASVLGQSAAVQAGELVRRGREAAGLTQYDFAEWLQVSRQTVPRLEAGQSTLHAPAEGLLVELCRVRGLWVVSEPELRALLAAARSGAPALEAPVEHDLFGRDDALAALRVHLASSRLVTVTGPGGV